jgi:hypothetical protein
MLDMFITVLENHHHRPWFTYREMAKELGMRGQRHNRGHLAEFMTLW